MPIYLPFAYIRIGLCQPSRQQLARHRNSRCFPEVSAVLLVGHPCQNTPSPPVASSNPAPGSRARARPAGDHPRGRDRPAAHPAPRHSAPGPARPARPPSAAAPLPSATPPQRRCAPTPGARSPGNRGGGTTRSAPPSRLTTFSPSARTGKPTLRPSSPSASAQNLQPTDTNLQVSDSSQAQIHDRGKVGADLFGLG